MYSLYILLYSFTIHCNLYVSHNGFHNNPNISINKENEIKYQIKTVCAKYIERKIATHTQQNKTKI